jgi:peroxiredoxin
VSTPTRPTGGRTGRPAKASTRSWRDRPLLPWITGAVITVLVLATLYVIFQSGTQAATTASQPGEGGYAVGSPGPGEAAPDFTLPSTTGEPVSLSDYQGESTLVYFHEGLGCQACWDQIRDLEASSAQLEEAGIDELVTITTGPVDLIAQKMADDGLSSLALADTDLAVSRQYEANKYGMMGETRPGHSFLLVGPEGDIQWRADYGGAPDYTMYLPVPKILADLEAGRVSA